MTRLVTFTANLLAEHTFGFPSLTPGATHRASSASFQVGGKGINVSKMLHRLGTPSLAVAFAGGPPGQACSDWLAAQPFPSHLIPTTSPTRSGFVVRSTDGPPETSFLGPDSPPDPDAFAAAAEFLNTLPALDFVALCGSIPGWSSPAASPFRQSLFSLASSGRLLVDTYGPPLADLIHHPLALLKINAHEFLDLPSVSAFTPEALTPLASSLPVQRWIVTDGPRPTLALAPGQPVTCHHPPSIKEISATGSGDVTLAAFVHHHFIQQQAFTTSLDIALRYGAANAASPGVADFDLNQPALLLSV